MANLEWVHALAAVIGAIFGAVGGIFVGGYRVGQIEGALKLSIAAGEKIINERLDESVSAFDETLKGLRQKINDVELYTERPTVYCYDVVQEDYRSVQSGRSKTSPAGDGTP